jgi:hypothetical protein
MRRVRFRISSLLITVVLAAIGFAAIRESDDRWDSGLFSLILLSLLMSVLLAIHRPRSRRAYWLGFAIWGSSYLVLSLIPSIEPRLMTTKGLVHLDSHLPGRSISGLTIRLVATGTGSTARQVSQVAFTPDGTRLAVSSPGQLKLWDVTTGKPLGGWNGTSENLVRIGHSIVALLAALLGGCVSRRLFGGQEAQASGSAATAPLGSPTGESRKDSPVLS